MDEKEIEKIIRENPHLAEYLESIKDKMEMPKFYSQVPRDLKGEKYPNLIYPTKETIFIHIYRLPGMEEIEYHAIEPTLSEEEKKKRDMIMERLYEEAIKKKEMSTKEEIRELIRKMMDRIVVVSEKGASTEEGKKKGLFGGLAKSKIVLTPLEREKIEYDITKNIVGGGPLEPFMRDPYIEDVHVITGQNVYLVHKVFEMVKTNIFIDEKWAPTFSQEFSEKIGSPVSDGQPIADGTLPDGSRVNIIHSKDVSLKGPTMTIRKFSETPISVTQLIKWGTMSAGIAAYLWLCLQYGRSVFVCGETASGKTTTTNAIIPFIPPEKKIYTAENTPEVHVPHPVWQQLLTRSTGPKESHVDLTDLLDAALRSRPDYIIPGEVRGIEARVVFQAMQTGHPVITTFHAGSVTKVIQRFTGHPINIPKPFMDNLDVILIQMAVERKGKRIRRVLSVEEIEGYNKEVDAIMSRRAFEWNPVDDTHLFRANRNSYILEEKIAKNAGFEDRMQIYEEFDLRKKILERMVEEGIMDYYEVVKIVWTYYKEGVDGLPFSV
ncbi:MAG: type II/IV secretion system ATPase subunit [Thermoplasmata archaeon]|nr:type II/IV secretion system ATPase subunit [Thermoplasmata archaeon]